ncbi:hypothetical protein PG987_007588 [Apiospora arundinis]
MCIPKMQKPQMFSEQRWGGHDGDDGRNITINWDSTAAIDYFGSPNENFAYSEHILRTLALASGVDTGWRNGGDDLANRAILVACNDPMDRCKSVSTAYTYNGLDQDTVDNYVYYVMSRWIEVKNANEYPPYPVAWNPDQSRRWNEDREASEPGTPLPVTAALDIEDSDVAYKERPGIYAPVYAKDMYPKWYAPILEAMDSESGNVTVDVRQPPVNKSAPHETRDPSSHTIRCNSTETSPAYFDYVHAFQADSYRQIPVHQGKKGENHWVAYVQSCAVNVFYHEDWDSNCNATVGDVLDYAKSILRRCNDGLLGPSGRCEGQVSFMLPNCPADIQILHTTTDG